MTVITDFYAAKKAIDGTRTGGDVSAIMTALGYETPTHAVIDGKKVKVFKTEGYNLLRGREDARTLFGTRSTYEPEAPCFLIATSKADAARKAGAPGTRVTKEIDPSDYRYHLVATHPDCVVFTERGREFGEPTFLPLPEQA